MRYVTLPTSRELCIKCNVLKESFVMYATIKEKRVRYHEKM